MSIEFYQIIFDAYLQKNAMPEDVQQECLEFLRRALQKVGKKNQIDLSIKSIYLKNFGPHAEVNLKFDNGKCVAIVGENNVGKSFLVEAIPWIFYGKTTTGVIAQDLVTLGAPEVIGEIVFINNDDHFVVNRRWAQGNSYSSLEKNHIPVTCKAKADIQNEINKAIGLSFDEFVHTSFWTPDKCFLRLSDLDKKEVLESVCTGPVFSTAFDLYSKNIANKGTDAKIEQMEAEKQWLIGQLTTIHKINEALSLNSYTRKAEIQKEIAHYRALLETLSKEQEAIELSMQGLAAISVSKSSPIATEIAALSKTNNELSKKQIELNNYCIWLTSEVEKLTSFSENVCSTCGQSVEFTEEMQSSLQSYKLLLQTNSTQLTEVSNTLISNQLKFAELQQQQKTDQEEANKSNQKYWKLMNDLARVDTQIQNVEATIANKQQELEKAELPVNSDSELPSYEEKLANINVWLPQLKSEREKEHTVTYHLGSKGLIFFATEFMVESMNIIIQDHKSALNLEFDFHLSSTKEQKNNKVVQSVNAVVSPFSYKATGRGKRSLIDCLAQYALDRLLLQSRGNTGVIVMDDIGTYLSDNHFEKLLTLIKSTGKLVLVLSHNQVAINASDVVLKVESENGVSTIKEIK